jgi:hypothetical protein
LVAGSLVVATAVLASPVAASLDSDAIQFGWSRTSSSNDYVDQTWWAIRSRCIPDNVAERLLAIPVSVMARRTGARFEAELSDETGLPLPEGWALATAKNSPLIRSVYAETPRDLAAVLGFYRTTLGERGWTENDHAVVEADRAVIAFTTAHGPALLRLSREGDKTISELSQRKRAEATAGLLPKPGQVKLMLGNKTDDEAVITVNDQTIRLAAHAGEKLANSDATAGELPDGLKLDLPPGSYKVTLKVAGSAADNREFEVAANETWGLLVGPDGALLPMHLY